MPSLHLFTFFSVRPFQFTDFLNNGTQSVGRHKYDFISVYYAAFSKQLLQKLCPATYQEQAWSFALVNVKLTGNYNSDREIGSACYNKYGN